MAGGGAGHGGHRAVAENAQQAIQASDWKAFEQVVEEAATVRQPPSLLLRLARQTPSDSPIRFKVMHRIRQAYPGNFWANHHLANSLQYRQSPQSEEAIRYYTAALALRPGNPAECVNLGNALRDRGDLDGAIRAYREALDGHSDYAAAHERLGLALEKKGLLDEAIAELRQTIHFRNYAPDHVVLGNMLVRKGLRDDAIPSYKLAIACYRTALELHPGNACSHNDLAWILVTGPHPKLHDPTEGVKLARKAVELGPREGAFWNTLGAASYRAGNWKEAIAALEKAMLLRNGGDSLDWFFLAMAHWQRGDKEKARQWFEQAVAWMEKNQPKNQELRRFRAEAAELMKVEPKKD